MEEEVKKVVERMFTHVASFPWKDDGWAKSEAAVQAAKEQIVNTTVREVMDSFEGIIGARWNNKSSKRTDYEVKNGEINVKETMD